MASTDKHNFQRTQIVFKLLPMFYVFVYLYHFYSFLFCCVFVIFVQLDLSYRFYYTKFKDPINFQAWDIKVYLSEFSNFEKKCFFRTLQVLSGHQKSFQRQMLSYSAECMFGPFECSCSVSHFKFGMLSHQNDSRCY